jgi:ankyrin repeat protein
MWAASLGSAECVQFLIESGADTALTSEEGKTAYDYAVEKGYEDIAQLLRPNR